MSLDDAVRSSVRSLAAKPAGVLPFYVAGLAVPVVMRVVPVAGLLLAYLSLQGTGRLEAVREVLEPAAPINRNDPGDVDVDDAALEEAVLDLFTPTVIAIIVATVLVSIVVSLAFQAVVGAGRYHAVFAVLQDRPPTRAGVEGVFSHTWTFLALLVVELLAYLVVVGIPVGWVLVGVFVFDSPLFVVPAFFALLGAIPLLIVFRFVLAFAKPAAVVEGVGAAPALRHGARHVRSNAFQVLGYAILALGATGVGNLIGSTFSQAGAATASTLVPLVFVFPFLDLVKTTLYARDRSVPIAAPDPPEADPLPRLRRALRRGLASTWSFTRGHVGAGVASAALFVAGIGLGLWAGQQVDDLVVASIESRIEGMNPVIAFVHFATNNWTVAAGQSLAGLVLGIPTAVSLAYNGAVIGVAYQLETDPAALQAFLVPHGVIELPALVISGALGLHLGGIGLGYVRGTIDRDGLAAAIDHAFEILVGLAVLFVLAGLIEGFVSPYYWQILGI